jgi:hypothetical protein
MAQEMSPKLYAQHVGIDEGSVWDWINGRGPVLIEDRDIRQVHGKLWLIAVQAPNAAGLGARPQFKPNPAYKYMRRKLVHKSGSTGPMDVVTVEGPGVVSVSHPTPENIQGDIPFSVISRKAMAKALQVSNREPGTLHA